MPICSSWGEKAGANETIYDNIGNFFKTGTATDTNLSVAGGNQNGNFYLSTSYYNQSGIIPTTGYDKTTIRFNGEQRWKSWASATAPTPALARLSARRTSQSPTSPA